jgi:hypothetical protein
VDEIIPVGEVDRRHRPNPRAVDKAAVGADQPDRTGLRDSVQSIGKEAMDVLGAQQACELFRTVDTGGEHHRPGLLQDEIDCLQPSCRLLGQHDAEIGHLLLGIGDRFFAPVPDCQQCRNDDDDEQPKPGQ